MHLEGDVVVGRGGGEVGAFLLGGRGDELPLARSTVSEHLRILRSAGLVQANDNGPRVSYCIVPPALRRLKALLEAV